jgi:hypothetical protein
MADSASGSYLFAVTRGLDTAALQGQEGLRGAPLRAVTHEDLQAVVCTVDLGEFGEDALTDHLEDLEWLEEVARRHNEVVWLAAQHATTAPARLVTIFAGDDRVAAMLVQHRDQLTRSLDSVEGCQEWSVKLYAARAPVEPEARAPVSAGAGAGAAYLQRKKAAAQQRRQSSEQSARLAESAYQALASVAVASRRLPAQDPRLTGRSDTMVLNAAFLVPVERREELHAAVAGIDDGGGVVTAEIGGPWPAYSFATLERS